MPLQEARDYFPPPESQGGWRRCVQPGKVGFDAGKLAQLFQTQLWVNGGHTWGAAIIRNGYLVGEQFTFNVNISTRFDIWSAVKSVTATAWGMLIDDARAGRLSRRIDLDTPAYDLIPEGFPLSDPNKKAVTLRHLLTMTSAIPGESTGFIAVSPAADTGPFELALGFASNRYGRSAATLLAEPGTVWDYSDAAFAHLGIAFANAADRDIDAYLGERVFRPIGIENLSWDVQGGSGFIGPHTNAHTGIHVSPRELARFGYLYLRQGFWAGERLLPDWWIAEATKPSQRLNPHYGYAIWTNEKGDLWPGVPSDAYGFLGFHSNACYVVPSLDLVVVRIGSGPNAWDNRGFIGAVVEAITEK